MPTFTVTVSYEVDSATAEDAAAVLRENIVNNRWVVATVTDEDGTTFAVDV
jgi:hypothetical protein